MIELDKEQTALVVIDLQKGIVSRPSAPYSSEQVITNASKIADACRKNNIPVILVHVAFNTDNKDRLIPKTDAPAVPASSVPFSSDFVETLGPQSGDIVITKKQWELFMEQSSIYN